MQVPLEYEAIRQATERLSEVLRAPHGSNSVRYGVPAQAGALRLDAVFTAGPHSFALEWKGSGSLGQVALAADTLKRATSDSRRSWIPVVAVPYMGEVGRSYCEREGVAWMDLSGNAGIVAPGLYVQIVGHPNRYRRPGIPESAFGPKGARIARWLLMHPTAILRQRELASATGLDEGYTSRVVRKLIKNQLVAREREGIRIRDADRLLDAWHEVYRFDKHSLLPGHIAAVSGERLAHAVSGTLAENDVPYAITGLAAAWAWTRHASFRLLTVYLREHPSAKLITSLGFRKEPRGANIWLVTPNDEGVFHGAEPVNGIRCVHPVQAYLDLKNHPERAREAADEIRSRRLSLVGDDR